MQNKKNPLIFVVEDNQMYNKLVVSYLKTNKFSNVESFHTGEDALKNMDKNPDIVIQDYLLDGMTGIEVLWFFPIFHNCNFCGHKPTRI